MVREKIVSIGLLVTLFASILAFPAAATSKSIDPCEYPPDTLPEVNQMANVFFLEMCTIREDALQANPDARIAETYMPFMLRNASLLYSVGAREIEEIQIKYIEGSIGMHCFDVQITDDATKRYYMALDEAGITNMIRENDKNGILLWNDAWESTQQFAPIKWWQTLPGWAQWILRYVCFGWIWID